MSEDLSYYLKKIRKPAKLSQSDLAVKTGLTSAAVSHFETGQRRPSLDNLVKLVDALSVYLIIRRAISCLFSPFADASSSHFLCYRYFMAQSFDVHGIALIAIAKL